ncbi:MAG: DUF5672 family protein [Pseudomonadota bacterium]
MADKRLALSQVTLCAATSVNVAATIRALETSMAQIDFAECKLFTDARVTPDHPAIKVVPIKRLNSAAAYSSFILKDMVEYVETTHCLITQWDGHVLDAGRWRDAFLDHDYIGASWPQFTDGHDVGNGGFSLRSRKLMDACRNPKFVAAHPEDLAIGRGCRPWLESRGMRFAPRALADMFATERAGDLRNGFGYHGVWHMPRAIGVEAFWDVYRTLDDRSTTNHDFADILRQMWQGRGGGVRVCRMIADRVRHAVGLVPKL